MTDQVDICKSLPIKKREITKIQNSITKILEQYYKDKEKLARQRKVLQTNTNSIHKYFNVCFKVEDDKLLGRGLHFPISTKPNQAVQEQTEQELKDNISERENINHNFLAESM